MMHALSLDIFKANFQFYYSDNLKFCEFKNSQELSLLIFSQVQLRNLIAFAHRIWFSRQIKKIKIQTQNGTGGEQILLQFQWD
ncbi:unnamed protein product [Paramecium octaurelia]|uniref:Uncharacterized protein n=1 Tax=Paramecium octaurelia TaxID=43137 RepID=A0A8S1XX61_PAROT|nr:unnamed protein product [Paramecium octaurelia]